LLPASQLRVYGRSCRCFAYLDGAQDGIGVAFALHVSKRAVWAGTGRKIFLGIGVLFALMIAAPPASLHGPDVETALAKRLGYPVEISGAHWRWDPWPAVELRDAVAHPRGSAAALPLTVRSQQVLIRGLPFGLRADQSPYRAIEFSGLELHSGPFGLRDAFISLEDRRDIVELKGRALGTSGGSIEISGTLGGRDPKANPLRIYLAQLELPVVELFETPPDAGWGNVRVSGVVTIEGDLDRRQEIDFDLEGAGLRQEGIGDWLRTLVRGRLIRQGGRFVAGNPVRVSAEVRELGAARDLRVVHGGIDLSLDVEGDTNSGHVVVDADLEKLRLRLGSWLEKPSNTPGSIRYEAHWAPAGHWSGNGTFELGKLRARVDGVSMGKFAGWRVRGLSLPLSELQAYVPALRVLPRPPEGELELDLHRTLGGGTEGQVWAKGVRLSMGSQSIKIPRARIDLVSDRAVFEAPKLVVGGQTLSLSGSIEWVPSPGRLHLRLDVRAGQLDLERLMAVASPLWGGDGKSTGPAGPNASTEIATAIVQKLRAHPRMLTRLQIESAVLKADRLRGFGLDTKNAHYRLVLVDRLLQLEQASGSGSQGPTRYALDLQGWVPKLTQSR